MAHKLDRSRPYGMTMGPDYQFYDQDGRQFTMSGELVGEAGEEPAPPPIVRPRGRPPKVSVQPKDHGLLDLANAELKVLVEVNGGSWSDRQAAIRFLSGT